MYTHFLCLLHHGATIGGFGLGLTLLWALAAPRPLWRSVLLILFTLSQGWALFKLIVYAYGHRDPIRELIARHSQAKPALLATALVAAAFKLSVPLLLA